MPSELACINHKVLQDGNNISKRQMRESWKCSNFETTNARNIQRISIHENTGQKCAHYFFITFPPKKDCGRNDILYVKIQVFTENLKEHKSFVIARGGRTKIVASHQAT